MTEEKKGNFVVIDHNVCKGCGVCIDACPKQCLMIGSEINGIGYRYVKFDSVKCTACGMCFYTCPEPGTITVIKEENK